MKKSFSHERTAGSRFRFDISRGNARYSLLRFQNSRKSLKLNASVFEKRRSARNIEIQWVLVLDVLAPRPFPAYTASVRNYTRAYYSCKGRASRIRRDLSTRLFHRMINGRKEARGVSTKATDNAPEDGMWPLSKRCECAHRVTSFPLSSKTSLSFFPVFSGSKILLIRPPFFFLRIVFRRWLFRTRV